MNPVQSAEGAAYAGGMCPVAQSSDKLSTKGRSVQTPDRSAGMEGALQLSGDFVRHLMRERGFVDIQANGVEIIETFTQYEPPPEYDTQVGLNPGTATEVATLMKTQTSEEMNQILRILAHVDPARVAALLK
jgi:hypothetical protein